MQLSMLRKKGGWPGSRVKGANVLVVLDVTANFHLSSLQSLNGKGPRMGKRNMRGSGIRLGIL